MDSDLSLYGMYDDIAWDGWLNNPRLVEDAQRRHDEVSGWKFGSPIAHAPTIALDYLLEAKLTHSFGFYRSSIFCCAVVLDLELKRCLMKYFAESSRAIKRQTFGQSIQFASDQNPPVITKRRLDKLSEINNIRNKVSVHPFKEVNMVSCEDDETPFLLSPEGLEQFFLPEEVAALEEQSKLQGLQVDLLEKLSFKIIWWTKKFIADGTLLLTQHPNE